MNSQATFTVGGIVLLLAASQAFGGLRGDMNNDGNRDGDDIQRFVEVLVSPFDATVEETCAADTSENRLLTIEDVPPMVQLLLGLIPPQYAVRGHWDTPFAWGTPGALITPIHMAVVPTLGPSGEIVGQAYSFGHYGDPNFYLWNPASEQFTPVLFPFGPFNRQCRVEPPPATAMLFCSGHSLMANGKVLHTGGNIAAEDLQCEQGGAPAGSTWAFEFDPLTPLDGDPWTQVADMANGRWYPTNTILPDGRMLVVSGFNACSFCDHGQPVTTVNSDIEIYTPGTPGAWSVVSQKEISLYPFMHVIQSGQVLLSGPGSLSEIFDPQTNQWTPVAQSQFAFRGSGTGVLLPGDADRVMIIGGDCCGQTATNTTEVLDLGGNPPQWQSGPSMVNARTHANAVLLPDGTVSVIGGRSDFGFGANPDPVYQAEILAPSTPWQEMASMCRPRMYHSTAVLLPDGRVLSAGGTAAGPQFPADERNAEIFYPPYLFKGPRPQILSVPTSAKYGEQFAVQTPSSSQIVAVTLVRPSSVTHSFNMDQRHVSLQFELGEVPESLLVDAPPNSNLAPPGYYMLFILSLGVDGQSLVPSVAEFIRLDLSSK